MSAVGRIAGRVSGSAVVFVPDARGEVRVRWQHRRGWRCDLDGSSRTARCEHVTAAVGLLTAHLLTVAARRPGRSGSGPRLERTPQ